MAWYICTVPGIGMDLIPKVCSYHLCTCSLQILLHNTKYEVAYIFTGLACQWYWKDFPFVLWAMQVLQWRLLYLSIHLPWRQWRWMSHWYLVWKEECPGSCFMHFPFVVFAHRCIAMTTYHYSVYICTVCLYQLCVLRYMRKWKCICRSKTNQNIFERNIKPCVI